MLRVAARRIANRAVDLLFIAPLTRYWIARLGGQVLCLLYHRVDNPSHYEFLTAAGSPVVEPKELEDDLVYLQAAGARFLTFADLRVGRVPPQGEFGVIVCFDDGFADNYSNGLPLVDALGIKAVVFQTAGLVDAKTLLWEHAIYWYAWNPATSADFRELVQSAIPSARQLASRPMREFLDFLRSELVPQQIDDLLERARHWFDAEKQLVELAGEIYPKRSDIERAAGQGHEIGAHGYNHCNRVMMSSEAFEADMRRSIVALKAVLGSAPQAFAYPFGRFCDGDDGICARYFSQAAIVHPVPINERTAPMRIPRCTWPGPARNQLRKRRWLLTGRI